MEFVALANHRKAIRAEIAASAERFRAEQLKGLERVLARYGVDHEECPAIVCAVLITSISGFWSLSRSHSACPAGTRRRSHSWKASSPGWKGHVRPKPGYPPRTTPLTSPPPPG